VADPKVWSGELKGGVTIWGAGYMLPRKFVKILGKSNAFWCKIFTCFKTHSVNRKEAGVEMK